VARIRVDIVDADRVGTDWLVSIRGSPEVSWYTTLRDCQLSAEVGAGCLSTFDEELLAISEEFGSINRYYRDIERNLSKACQQCHSQKRSKHNDALAMLLLER